MFARSERIGPLLLGTNDDSLKWWAYLSPILLPLLLVSFSLLGPLKSDYYFAAAGLIALCWVGPRARTYSFVMVPFAVTGLIYDLAPLFLAYRWKVHVEDLWHWEHWLFALPGSGLSLSDWISSLSFPIFDAIAGIAYLTYLLEIALLAAWFCFRRANYRAQHLTLAFFLLNLAGWIIWFVFPAAPPWYVDRFGLGPAQTGALADTARAARFDALVGAPVFETFYARSTNVFGALPSLHAGYAVLGAGSGWNFGSGTRWFTVIYAGVICIAAMYFRHHYLLDVLLGAALVPCAFMAASWFIRHRADAPHRSSFQSITARK